MIEAKKEYNIGERPVTHRQAANAIWNKLNIAMMYITKKGIENPKTLQAYIKEAHNLADAIVNEPDYSDYSLEQRFGTIELRLTALEEDAKIRNIKKVKKGKKHG